MLLPSLLLSSPVSPSSPLPRAASRSLAAPTNASNSGRNSPVRQKFSGCHCTPTQKRASGDSMPSITPSGAVAVATSPSPSRADRLMVPAVDPARARRVHGAAERLVQPRSARDADVVRHAVLRDVDAVRQLRRHRRRDVLHERAAGGDVEDLRAAADRQERQVRVHRAAREIDLELVAPGLGVVDLGMPRLAVEDRIDVAAAREQRRRRAPPTSARGLSLTSSTRAVGARLLHRRDVVVEPAAARHADDRRRCCSCLPERVGVDGRDCMTDDQSPTSSPAPCSPSARAPS